MADPNYALREMKRGQRICLSAVRGGQASRLTLLAYACTWDLPR